VVPFECFLKKEMPNEDYHYPQFSVLPPPVPTKSAKTIATSLVNTVVFVEPNAKTLRLYPKTVDHFLRFGALAASQADDEWDFVLPVGAIVDITIPHAETQFNVVAAASDVLFLTQR